MQQNTNYKIIKIDSFEQAKEYGDFTNRWCVCIHEDDYKGYTFDNHQMYFCIREDYQDILKKETDNFPEDEYGLSMLLIIVDESGELLYASTRWNDIRMTLNVDKLEKILKVDFHKTFSCK